MCIYAANVYTQNMHMYVFFLGNMQSSSPHCKNLYHGTSHINPSIFYKMHIPTAGAVVIQDIKWIVIL